MKQINWIFIAVKVDRLNENGLGDRKPATPGYILRLELFPFTDTGCYGEVWIVGGGVHI